MQSRFFQAHIVVDVLCFNATYIICIMHWAVKPSSCPEASVWLGLGKRSTVVKVRERWKFHFKHIVCEVIDLSHETDRVGMGCRVGSGSAWRLISTAAESSWVGFGFCCTKGLSSEHIQLLRALRGEHVSLLPAALDFATQYLSLWQYSRLKYLQYSTATVYYGW